MNTRLDRTSFHIGTYILAPYARTEAHIRALAACGIDLVVGVNYDKPMLHLFQKHQITAVINGVVPGWWGGKGANAGTMQEVNGLDKYFEASKQFIDHPAICGIDIGDEPSAADLPHLGRVAKETEKLFPNQFAYTNLYPSYGCHATNTTADALHQLGVQNYRDYIEAYCLHVPLDYICYDHYLYSSSPDQALEDLAIVSDACRRYNRSLWIVLQVNSSDPSQWISINQLRFQAYSAMAHGARMILWACYTAGWFYNHVLDGTGTPTEQYAKLQSVNQEIRKITKHYMDYRNVHTHRISANSFSSQNGEITELRSLDNALLLVGEMIGVDDPSAIAFMLCTADDPMDTTPKSHTICFHSQRNCYRVITPDFEAPLNPDADGMFRFVLNSCHGAFLF